MKQMAKMVRWVARGLGVGAVVLFVILAIRDGLPDPLVLGVAEEVLYAALALMLIGVLAAWKWEIAGVVVTFTGYVLEWWAEGISPAPLFSLFPLAGCFFLIAWLLEHQPSAAPATPARKPGKKRAPR